MRALIPLLMLLTALVGCGRHVPTEEERRKDYPDAFIYPGAPACSIYVGLDTNESGLFATNFWSFATRYDIHRPKKQYMAYSGQPLATCKSDHISIFEFVVPTTRIIKNPNASVAIPSIKEQSAWQNGFWTDFNWITNACRITKNGHEIVAPLTGVVRMGSNDTNYPPQDFKQLAEALRFRLQTAFPDRQIQFLSIYGDKQ
jgi:hypothetical protein